ncbi:response regulator [Pleurocapsa sp. CCALA 161]|uniref:response regulator n=1 Tax=Pleurocapsa sp. CCALA 161 TaxID=2107688 RepID=UPI000D0577AC|nr:response regulator [Pleurocapsa sp. CCALA 161]PSB09764.1 response regulator [Pleurocapsa sp. CCALA 161]
MTTTIKLNLKRLLSQLADANSSGCLEISADLTWQIYLSQGKIQYVYCSAQLLEQLKYHLYYFGWQEAIAAIKQLPNSLLNSSSSIHSQPADHIYKQVILWLLAEHVLDLSQVLKLIQHITKDDLLSCLWLESGTSSWQAESTLPDWIPQQIQGSLSLKVAECLNEAEIKERQWSSCSEQLLSVYQRPYFPPSWEKKSLPVSGSLNHKVLTNLTQVLKGSTSIRQLSILLKKDEINVAKVLSPYIEHKIIYLNHPQAPFDKIPHIPRSIVNAPLMSFETNDNDDHDMTQAVGVDAPGKTWKIVCIDDSPTILSEIKRFLDQDKFQVTAIDDPVRAVSQVFKINPDLILLDITMPKINGYKLCGLLRNSGKCNHIPIIMVTGNTGLIDKARAKLSGATDYFTKPFSKHDLNQLVEKHLI